MFVVAKARPFLTQNMLLFRFYLNDHPFLFVAYYRLDFLLPYLSDLSSAMSHSLIAITNNPPSSLSKFDSQVLLDPVITD